MKKERAVIYTELTDPVWPSGNDPWVVRREDSYYYCWSTGSGVHVRAIRDLSDLADEGGSTVWAPEKGTAIVVYSASGSWTDAYCLGKLTLTGDDPMDPGSWTKEKDPIFQSGANTYGPGHCSFVTAPDGQLWMFYHANIHSGTGWNGRSCRAQPVFWDGATLELGDPAIPGEPIPLAVFE